MVGRIVSTKSQNTATVLVDRTVKHPLYKKTYLQTKKYLVDTGGLEVKEGDVVDFIACKPISKRKAWKITKVLGRNFAEIAEGQLKEKAEEAISEVMPEEESAPAEVLTDKKEEVEMDNSTKKAETKKKGRTELSKKKK